MNTPKNKHTLRTIGFTAFAFGAICLLQQSCKKEDDNSPCTISCGEQPVVVVLQNYQAQEVDTIVVENFFVKDADFTTPKVKRVFVGPKAVDSLQSTFILSDDINYRVTLPGVDTYKIKGLVRSGIKEKTVACRNGVPQENCIDEYHTATVNGQSKYITSGSPFSKLVLSK